MIVWRHIGSQPPPKHRTVLLYRLGDLYPVVGSRWGKDPHGEDPSRELYLLWEGGPEDGEHHTHPFLHENAEPTHWAELPLLPLALLGLGPTPSAP